jgi:hypothetical protein
MTDVWRLREALERRLMYAEREYLVEGMWVLAQDVWDDLSKTPCQTGDVIFGLPVMVDDDADDGTIRLVLRGDEP